MARPYSGNPFWTGDDLTNATDVVKTTSTALKRSLQQIQRDVDSVKGSENVPRPQKRARLEPSLPSTSASEGFEWEEYVEEESEDEDNAYNDPMQTTSGSSAAQALPFQSTFDRLEASAAEEEEFVIDEEESEEEDELLPLSPSSPAPGLSVPLADPSSPIAPSSSSRFEPVMSDSSHIQRIGSSSVQGSSPIKSPSTACSPIKPVRDRPTGETSDHTCGICGRRFHRASDLTKHSHTHTGAKPFKCPVEGCHSAFTQKSALTVHSRIHTGHKPYVCNFPGCNKAFSDSSVLSRHRKVHSQTKKVFECSWPGCGKEFGRNASMQRHLKLHSEPRQQKTKSLKTNESKDKAAPAKRGRPKKNNGETNPKRAQIQAEMMQEPEDVLISFSAGPDGPAIEFERFDSEATIHSSHSDPTSAPTPLSDDMRALMEGWADVDDCGTSSVGDFVLPSPPALAYEL